MKRDQVRNVDHVAIHEFGIPGVVLMENAGRGAAAAIDHVRQESTRIAILCGSGNNGGDGYVIARHLELMGYHVSIISLVPLEKLNGDAAINASIAVKGEIPIQVIEDGKVSDAISQADVLVDCLLGTGAIGPPRDAYGQAIRIANQSSADRISIDLPSGLDCDSGKANEPTFRAGLTLTFVAEKDGLRKANASQFVGEIQVIDIGVPLNLLQRFSREDG